MIDVAVVDEALIVSQNLRSRNRDQLIVSCRLKGCLYFHRNLKVRMSWVLLVVIQNHIFAREAGNDIDVTPCPKAVIVASQSTLYPDGLGGSKFGVNFCFNFLLAPAGVSAISQLHSFRKENYTSAIHVNAATLIY